MKNDQLQKIAGAAMLKIMDLRFADEWFPDLEMQQEILAALTQVRDAQEEKLKTAREALEFYAEEIRHQGANQNPIENDKYAPKGFDCYMWDVTRDRGEIAKEALSKIGGGV